MTRVFLVAAALLTASVGAIQLVVPDWPNVVLLSATMGMLATTMSSIGGQPASLGFLSGDLKNLGRT